ncbi:MAG: oligosaccharide flippase family protein, partial [bacterium]
MGHSIKKNTLFLSIGQFVQLVLAFLTVPFAARYLGEAGFGQYS